MIYMYIYMLFMNSMIMFILMLLFIYFKIVCLMQWSLMSLNSISMEFIMLIDWVSLSFISLVSLISSLVLLYSCSYMDSDKTLDRFFYLVLMFVVSMIFMIVSPNIMSILLGWDGLGLVSYGLIIYYQNWKSFNSGMVTVLLNRLGDVGILMMISLLMTKGSWNLMFYFDENFMLSLLLMMSACTKSAQLPFSVWLPLAMAAPTPVSSLVHSSTLVTAGVYLMIRFNLFICSSGVNKILFMISSLTMLMAGFVANFEVDLKKIIALSTLSQLGLMMSILSIGEVDMGFFHLFMHALFKSLLFMCSGIIIHLMMNNQDIRCMGNLIKYYPYMGLIFFFSTLSLCGFPFLSGFYSKDLIMEMFLMSKINMFSLVMVLLATIFTVSYSMRLFFLVFMNFNNKVNSLVLVNEDLLMNLSLIILFFYSVFGGFMFMNLFFCIENIIILKFMEKILVMIFFILGSVLGWFFSFYKSNFSFLTLKMKIYIDKMFGLEFMLNTFYNETNNWIYLYNMKMDKGLLEFIQVKGVKINFFKIYLFYLIKVFSLEKVIYYFVFLLFLFLVL